VTIKPIEWVWPGRLARGKLSTIAGDPEAGKSHITISITAAITKGGYWPCGEGKAPLGKVIILSAEDGKVDTVVPRLMAAGADLTKVRIIEAVKIEKDGVRSFDLAQDISRLECELTGIGDVVAFIIDPISSYLGRTDSHKNSNVRGVLEPLAKMAERTDVHVLAITHFNKSSANNNNSRAIHRFIDSIAFVAAARTAFIATDDPDCEGRKLLLHAKNNIAPSAKGLSYTIQGEAVCSNEGIIVETSKLVWGIAHVDQKADDVVRNDTEKRSAVTDAENFLRDVLKDGPVEAAKVRTEAEDAGIAWRTVERAKSRLGISSAKKHDTMEGPWLWRLPFNGQQPEGESKAANSNLENGGNA
jgi:putative DNA primase/helicase